MLIQNKEDQEHGEFYYEQDGERLAEIFYRKAPGRMIIEHTEVDESLRGQNVGFQMVEHAVEFAREQHLKVVPLCRFANLTIQKHKELQDVL